MQSQKKTAGVIVVVIAAMLMLAHMVSGLLLNHAAALQLERHFVSWNWLLKHYDKGEVEADAVYLIDNKIFSQFDGRVFVDAKPITHLERPVVGGIKLEDLIVLATDKALILLNREAEFVDRLGAADGVPAPIQNIGIYHGEPVVQAKSGMWRSNFMLDIWEPMSLQGVSWSEPHPMPDKVAADLQTFFHGKGVSLEQLLKDIHHGRVFGPAGVWLVDIISVLMLMLAMGGLWCWAKPRK
jgi:hypothetical protein